jgi:hypothetical protein
MAQPLQNLHVEMTSNTLSRRYELKVNQTVVVKNSGNFLFAHRIPLVEDYTQLFYMIDEGGITFIFRKMNLTGPKCIRAKVDGLSLILTEFYVP